MSDIKYTEQFKAGLASSLRLATERECLVGYDRVTITPQGKIIPIDTGLQGVLLSNKGKSTLKKQTQRDSDAIRDFDSEGVFSLNRKFIPIFQDNEVVLSQGGRGSGKTKAGAVALFLESYQAKRRNILVLRYNNKSLKDSIYAEVEALISKFNLEEDFEIKRDSMTNIHTGSQILFKGIKAGERDVKDKLKGITKLSYVLIEEAADINESFNEQLEILQGTMRDLGYFHRLHLILNPRSKAHAIYKRFLSKLENPNQNGEAEECYVVSTNYKDNPALDAKYVRRVEQAKDLRPTEYALHYLGQWQDVGAGQIIKNFEVGEFIETDSTCIGIDFGYRDETSAVLLSANHKEQMLYVKLLVNAPELTAEDMKYELAQFDTYDMIADAARPEIIADFVRDGFKMEKAYKGAGSVAQGLYLLQDYKIVIDKNNSEPIVEAFNGYFWSERRADTPNHDNSHIPDAIRYGFMYLSKNSNKGNYHIDGNDFSKDNSRYARKTMYYKEGEKLADMAVRRTMNSYRSQDSNFKGYGY